MENQRLIKAAVTSTTNLRAGGAGGLLNPEQANSFIDYMVDNSTILKRCTVYRITGDSRQLDNISVTSRVFRKGTENVDPGFTVGVGTGRRTVTTEEVVLPFDITFNFLEDNIERDGAEDHVARLMAMAFSNDVEDLGINGDTTSGDPFVNIKHGWLKIISTDAAVHKVAHASSTDYKGTVFPAILAGLPEKWKRSTGGLAYFVSPAVEESYRLSIANRATGLGDDVLETGRAVSFAGIPVVATPLLAGSNTHLLTRPENMVFAIKRAIRVGRFVNERTRRIEYTMSARVGYEWINPDAAVYSPAS